MSVTAPRGFEAAGTASGIKESGAPDLALVATSDREPVAAAGVFTSNLAQAAPVLVSKEHLADGRAAAVILNSGNANAATGEPGRAVTRHSCALVAGALGCEATDVLACSTGLIGIPLSAAPFEAGVPKLAADLAATPAAAEAAAQAMLTTDTVRKESTRTVDVAGGAVTVGGMAKGAAMLSPAMATMLAVLTTDAAATPAVLHAALTAGVADTFNALLVDGCTSTNDTVLVLASGLAGGAIVDEARGADFDRLVGGITEVCDDLARAMAADAEGATKLATVVVRGAASTDDARRAARGVAGSQLVQCSLYGKDPYWGRVLSELGASGATFDPERVDIAYSGTTICRDGVAAPHDEAAVTAAMAARELEIVCDLHVGGGEASVRFTDLTHAYVDENMGTS